MFLTLFVQAGTTFFDNQDDFFIMGEILEDGSIQQAGGGSSGGVLSGIPGDTGRTGDKEESPEEDGLGGNKLFLQIIFLAFFFLAIFFILHTQKIIFRLLRI